MRFSDFSASSSSFSSLSFSSPPLFLFLLFLFHHQSTLFFTLPTRCFFYAKYSPLQGEPTCSHASGTEPGAFPGQMRWVATVGNRGNLGRDRRATFTAEVEDACGNKLTQRAVEFPRHPSLEHCCAGRPGTNGTWTAC